jgi:hypothetical protein
MNSYSANDNPDQLDAMFEEFALASDRVIATLMAALEPGAASPDWWAGTAATEVLQPFVDDDQTRADIQLILRESFNSLLFQFCNDVDEGPVDPEIGEFYFRDETGAEIATETHHAMSDHLAYTRRDPFDMPDPEWEF